MTNTYKINNTTVVDGNTDIVVRNITVSGNVSVGSNATLPKITANSIIINTNSVIGVDITANSVQGIRAVSISNRAVEGRSNSNFGVYGFSNNAQGVYGEAIVSSGVEGHSNTGIGIYGQSNTNWGIRGESGTNIGVSGYSPTYLGTAGQSLTGYGIYGQSNASVGVWGVSNTGQGVYGTSTSNHGVYGITANTNLAGVYGQSSTPGVYGMLGQGPSAYVGAGYFYHNGSGAFVNDLTVSGNLVPKNIIVSNNINANTISVTNSIWTGTDLTVQGSLNVSNVSTIKGTVFTSGTVTTSAFTAKDAGGYTGYYEFRDSGNQRWGYIGYANTTSANSCINFSLEANTKYVNITGGNGVNSLLINGYYAMTTYGGTFTSPIRISNGGGNTGILYFGTGDHYLYYDGTNYVMNNADVTIGSSLAVGLAITCRTTLTATGGIITNGAYIDIVRDGIMRCRLAVDGSGNMILQNGDTNDNWFYVTPGGAVWTKQLGDLYTYITNRINNKSARLAYLADYEFNPRENNLEPYGGGVVTGGRYTASGQLYTSRFRQLQMSDAAGNWYACGYV